MLNFVFAEYEIVIFLKESEKSGIIKKCVENHGGQ